MDRIINFYNEIDDGVVSWEYRGDKIEKKIDGRIIAKIISNDAVIVLMFYVGMTQDNAIIYNADGGEKIIVKNPLASQGAICFEDAYFVKDDLTLIIAFKTKQVACVVNEDGEVIRLYETR